MTPALYHRTTYLVVLTVPTREISAIFQILMTVRRYKAGVIILLAFSGACPQFAAVYVNIAESCLQAFVTIPISQFKIYLLIYKYSIQSFRFAQNHCTHT